LTACTASEGLKIVGSTRQDILDSLRGSWLSAHQLSQAVGIREREVYEHLEHIRLSLARGKDETFLVQPARCLACGFAFRKRARLTAPSRCPVCRGEHISDPLYRVEARP
jgi:predicted Zn-ribbon and HTH transcriptional regulator